MAKQPSFRFISIAGITMSGLLSFSFTAYGAPVSIFTVFGDGFTSLDKGVTQLPFDLTPTNLPNGGQMIAGGSQQEVRNPNGSEIITVSAAGGGVAIARPGSMGVKIDGVASFSGEFGDLGGHVKGTFSSFSRQFLPITSSTLATGTEVNFTTSFHIDGVTSSERTGPDNGPYTTNVNVGYDTGTYFFKFDAYVVDPTATIVTGSIVSSGTYSFPNALFTSIPTKIDFGQVFNMSGKVGDLIWIDTSLELRVDDRAFGEFNVQASHLDFSNTVNMFADPVTPGLDDFVANGHNYSSVSAVPLPPALWLLAPAIVGLGLMRRIDV